MRIRGKTRTLSSSLSLYPYCREFAHYNMHFHAYKLLSFYQYTEAFMELGSPLNPISLRSLLLVRHLFLLIFEALFRFKFVAKH